MPDESAYDRFIERQASALRANDRPPSSLAEWSTRRQRLRETMLAAMGTFPDKPCELSPRVVGTLKRDGYRIEKILFQSLPETWVSASLYVPDKLPGKAPAVLCVHGHWPLARRDPVVQARCLGLVKLGFVVLDVDAFSAGERHPVIARGSYHGALLGSTLWPVGLSLLGVQVYENRRAIDYLLTRPEVDGTKLGITGASGGGNQSTYAGALDERIQAVIPVCSVGRYQSYLKAACCVCEVLPGALRFTEEGDVLGLIAPRALLVISATKDAYQFSVGEAKKSLERTKAIYSLYKSESKLVHGVFESNHDYNQSMRELAYGWFTRWLKGEGDGKPIAEPSHEVETVESLACYPEGKRPKSFVFASNLAAREAQKIVQRIERSLPDHREAWEARAVLLRAQLEDVLGGLPKPAPLNVQREKDHVTITVETGLSLRVLAQNGSKDDRTPTAVLVHLEGAEVALAHPVAKSLSAQKWHVVAPELRATGLAKPPRDGIAGAPDHNSAEHGVWIGRPLLGQWVVDLRATLEHLSSRRVALIGLGQAGMVATVAGALFADRLRSVVLVDALTSWIPQSAYPSGTRMGLLAPGILTVGDVPHLASLIAPTKLVVVRGFSSSGSVLNIKQLTATFAFTRQVYGLLDSDRRFQMTNHLESIHENV